MITLPALFIATSLQLGLPKGLLASVCYVETRHTPTAIHKQDGVSDSLGICQLKYDTAKGLGFKGTTTQLMDPATNIFFAGKYLRHQILRYGDVRKAVIAYNKGHAGNLTSSKYQDRVYKQWRNYENY
jgi:soluble lytic murein transglycosylase-like protein